MVTSLLALILLRPQESFEVQKDQVYASPGGSEQKFDIYRPVGSGDKSLPLIIAVHGGSWTSGRKEEMVPLAKPLCEAGFAMATINYRLAPKSKWPAQIDDCQTAVRYFRANASKWHIDPKRIGATGASAGGHLALLLGSRDTRDLQAADFPSESSRVSGVLNFFGPVDLSQDFAIPLADMLSQQVIGKHYTKDLPEVKEFSPITYIDSKTAPVYTVHGIADTLVPVHQARELDDALDKAGVKHGLTLVPGMQHGFYPNNPDFIEGVRKGVAFLKEQLGEK